MEFLKSIYDGLLVAIGIAWSYVMYRIKTTETERAQFEKEIKHEINGLKLEQHRLDKSQVKLIVELRQMKDDISYIRKNIEKITDKL